MSIYRISSNTISDNGINQLRNREYSMDKVNNQINTNKKYRLPRENPVDVTQAMTFHSKIDKIDHYLRNIQDVEGERKLVESSITNTIEILQRVRELAVQGSNGVYSADDRKNMATEIDQLLGNIIQNSNMKYKGNFIFSGFKKYTKPFEVLEGAVRGAKHAMITKVKYLGDNGEHLRTIDTDEYVSSSPAGSDVFWADKFQVYSQVNTANFRLTQDSTIMIDKQQIKFNAGDNIYAIVDKINRSKAAVNASIDMVTGGLVLKTTSPHKMELSDIKGGTLLQDLGILETGFPMGPDNFNQNATVFNGSIFDTMIGLRDSMLQNNAEDIGGRFLGSIDSALNNLTGHVAQTGALTNKLETLSTRLTNDKESYTTTLTELEDIDITESITNLKKLEFAHRSALGALARLSRTSLMDFLR